MRVARLVPVLAFVGVGCISPASPDIDLDGLLAIPAVDALSFASIQPAAAWDYWELRFVMPGSEDRVVGSSDSRGREALAPAVVSQLGALAPHAGFGVGCLPGYCFHFVAAVRDDEVTTFPDTASLRGFLGDLDTMDEAALLLHALGFYWVPDAETTGYRVLPGVGWEFVALELVAVCAPVQTDRVLLRAHHSGSVSALAREVWQKEARACI